MRIVNKKEMRVIPNFPYFATVKFMNQCEELALVGETYTIRIRDGHTYTTSIIKDTSTPFPIGTHVTLVQE